MLKVFLDVRKLKKPMMTNIQREPRTSPPDIHTTSGLNKTQKHYFQQSNLNNKEKLRYGHNVGLCPQVVHQTAMYCSASQE